MLEASTLVGGQSEREGERERAACPASSRVSKVALPVTLHVWQQKFGYCVSAAHDCLTSGGTLQPGSVPKKVTDAVTVVTVACTSVASVVWSNLF